jgi:putative flippase GtrA
VPPDAVVLVRVLVGVLLTEERLAWLWPAAPRSCLALGLSSVRARAVSPCALATLPRMVVEDSAVEVRGAAVAPRTAQPHMRLLHGIRRPANWLQLIRFAIVGASGFAINLGVYALCVHAVGIPYQVAAVAAWLVAVMSNFLLNRHWTFDASAGRIHFQAVRFFTVSLVAFALVNLVLLTLLVEVGGLAKVPAQALAVAAATPFNFLGNKLWSFRAGT